MHALQNSARFLRCILDVPRYYLLRENLKALKLTVPKLLKKRKTLFMNVNYISIWHPFPPQYLHLTLIQTAGVVYDTRNLTRYNLKSP
jgi:hypothetical protein